MYLLHLCFQESIDLLTALTYKLRSDEYGNEVKVIRQRLRFVFEVTDMIEGRIIIIISLSHEKQRG